MTTTASGGGTPLDPGPKDRELLWGLLLRLGFDPSHAWLTLAVGGKRYELSIRPDLRGPKKEV